MKSFGICLLGNIADAWRASIDPNFERRPTDQLLPPVEKLAEEWDEVEFTLVNQAREIESPVDSSLQEF